jgi:hypothetical protein
MTSDEEGRKHDSFEICAEELLCLRAEYGKWLDWGLLSDQSCSISFAGRNIASHISLLWRSFPPSRLGSAFHLVSLLPHRVVGRTKKVYATACTTRFGPWQSRKVAQDKKEAFVASDAKLSLKCSLVRPLGILT